MRHNPINIRQIRKVSPNEVNQKLPKDGHVPRFVEFLFGMGGMDLPNAISLYEHFGEPRHLVGTGSYAEVYDMPGQSEAVIKVTLDQTDGEVLSILKTYQDRNEGYPLPGIPYIYEVVHTRFRIRRENWDTEGNLYLAVIEKVFPITSFGLPKTTVIDIAVTRLKAAIDLSFRSSGMRAVRDDIIFDQDSDYVAGHIDARFESQISKAMREMSDRLRAKSLEAEEKTLADLLQQASLLIRFLMTEGILMADLHVGNWGIRGLPDNIELVIMDFGLTSPGETEPTRDLINLDQE